MCFCLVGGLKCYECVASTTPCTTNSTCEERFDRCYSGVTTKGCTSLSACSSPISCCEEDLCNNATLHNANKYIGPSFFLMGLSSAAFRGVRLPPVSDDRHLLYHRNMSSLLRPLFLHLPKGYVFYLKKVAIIRLPPCFAGVTANGCIPSCLCIDDLSCCEGDLCNNAKYIGPSFFLVVLSSTAMYFL
ncbi:hypothetical protein N1851_026590 [Merluccius polli]|uniref:UPAR/Ly6 domain-containing protein n=1 Tax=Merluccius polli TaxID=89951 RepID=A0AA47MBJ0_MERPO|nr:hypothetical protein N1851_026590 [Merluccius polli]